MHCRLSPDPNSSGDHTNRIQKNSTTMTDATFSWAPKASCGTFVSVSLFRDVEIHNCAFLENVIAGTLLRVDGFNGNLAVEETSWCANIVEFTLFSVLPMTDTKLPSMIQVNCST